MCMFLHSRYIGSDTFRNVETAAGIVGGGGYVPKMARDTGTVNAYTAQH